MFWRSSHRRHSEFWEGVRDQAGVATGIAAAIDRLDASPALRVGILTGAGSAFCSGMDLKAFLTGEMPMLPGRGFGGLVEAPPQKPLICLVCPQGCGQVAPGMDGR